MESVITVYVQARAAGLQIAADGEQLVVRGHPSLEPIARAVLAHKPAILAILATPDSEVWWRVAAMRPQVPLCGPIPRLLARPGTPAVDAPGYCGACGDPLPEMSRYCCPPCVRAKWLVLNEEQER